MGNESRTFPESAVSMEFCEKLQELRKQKGITQEELAEILYVSRAAVSKWESGRGYPNIDSLKAIARYFSVTIDDLLSGDEVLNIAEEDHKQKESRFRDLVFGAMDSSVVMLLFLPFFGQKADEAIFGVSLLSLTGIEPYVKALYLIAVVGMIGVGILTLILQNPARAFWQRCKTKLSLLFNAGSMLVFIAGLQPYAASFLFVFLAIKAVMLIRQR